MHMYIYIKLTINIMLTHIHIYPFNNFIKNYYYINFIHIFIIKKIILNVNIIFFFNKNYLISISCIYNNHTTTF